uniref:HTH CENPB-type domain-containing protein n=1 Tax=Strongyloides venezuelensis TaxID=75913 RepID=A0A0K0FPS0_STRVS
MRRKSYTAEFKLNVNNDARIFGTRATAFKFEVGENMIRRWKQQEEKLTTCSRNKRAFRGMIPRWPEFEEIMKNWVIDRRTRNRGVTTIMVRKEAIQVAAKFGLVDFCAGSHWCQNFMNRNGFVVRRKTSVGQPLPDNNREKIRASESLSWPS